jgi:alpha-tubulin suppressor-like RCC1 family protein
MKLSQTLCVIVSLFVPEAMAATPGDLNGDDVVDRTDQKVLRSSLGRCNGEPGFISDTDYNSNGCTDLDDYRVWIGFYRDFSPPQPCNDCRPRSSRSLFLPPIPPVQPGHLSAGGASSCHVLAEGKVKCWGARPGDGSSSSGNAVSGPAVFVQDIEGKEITNATAVSVGNDHTCVIDGGMVKCWGANFFGQLGDGTNDSSDKAKTVIDISNATVVEAGNGFTCAIDGGLVKCWGDDGGGQLGDIDLMTGATSNSNVPVTVSDLPSPAIFLAAAEISPRVCAILENGETWCWGTLPFFLGQNPASCFFALCRPVILPITLTTIALGRFHACYLIGSTPSEVECAGSNAGQFFSPLDQVLSFNRISAGEDFNCGVDTDAIVWCWGLNNVGQLGDGTNNLYFYTTTHQAVGISNATDVAAGRGHACAIDSGVVKCWGSGVTTPTAVAGF